MTRAPPEEDEEEGEAETSCATPAPDEGEYKDRLAAARAARLETLLAVLLVEETDAPPDEREATAAVAAVAAPEPDAAWGEDAMTASYLPLAPPAPAPLPPGAGARTGT